MAINKMIMEEIKIGDRVRSKVSGFSGTVTAICEYLHGATTYAVTADKLVSGETKIEWFSASELVKKYSDSELSKEGLNHCPVHNKH